MTDALMLFGISALLVGCGAYVDSSLLDAGATDIDAETTPETNDASVSMPSPVDPRPSLPDEPLTGAVRLARSQKFDGYLTTASGQPLYMFVDDVAASQTTACLGDCARKWLPFDSTELTVSAGLDAADLARFHRQDGPFQVTYKGHPLYLSASESAGSDVTADGRDGRWFVARDYLAFFGMPVNFEPLGDVANNQRYLTDGFGRTLYVCLDDMPAAGAMPPMFSCTGECLATRPPFYVGATRRTTALPSSLDVRDVRVMVRPDGTAQVTYRGWPLYYYTDDIRVGDTTGHNQKAWRALDPLTFASATPAIDE